MTTLLLTNKIEQLMKEKYELEHWKDETQFNFNEYVKAHEAMIKEHANIVKVLNMDMTKLKKKNTKLKKAVKFNLSLKEVEKKEERDEQFRDYALNNLKLIACTVDYWMLNKNGYYDSPMTVSTHVINGVPLVEKGVTGLGITLSRIYINYKIWYHANYCGNDACSRIELREFFLNEFSTYCIDRWYPFTLITTYGEQEISDCEF